MLKIPKNFSGNSRNWVSKLWSHKNLSSWGPILGNFKRISKESVTGNDSLEIPRKFLKESHHCWRIWGNSSLLLLGDTVLGIERIGHCRSASPPRGGFSWCSGPVFGWGQRCGGFLCCETSMNLTLKMSQSVMLLKGPCLASKMACMVSATFTTFSALVRVNLFRTADNQG